MDKINEDKLGVYFVAAEDGGNVYVGGRVDKENALVVAGVDKLGTYQIMADLVAPKVKELKQEGDVKTPTRKPTFTANISDGGSGIDENSITLTLDGKGVKPVYAKETGTITYTPQESLGGGEHEVILTVKDKAGNETKATSKVSTPGELAIDRVFTINPVRSPKVEFFVDVDSSNAKFFMDASYTVTVEVYTVNGKKIASIDAKGNVTKQKIGSYTRFKKEANEGSELPVLPNGVYIYRVIVKDFEGKSVSKVNKLVIVK